jgi:hypothetical protein
MRETIAKQQVGEAEELMPFVQQLQANKKRLETVISDSIEREAIIKQLQAKLDKHRNVNEKAIGEILEKWLIKAYEMGVQRDRFSDQQSEADLPAIDLSYVPQMIKELMPIILPVKE